MENKFFFVQKREISGLGSDGWNFFKGGSSARKRLRWRIVYFVVRWFQIVGPQPMARSVCRELMSDEHTMAVMCVSEGNCEE